jgi:thymidylate synthase
MKTGFPLLTTKKMHWKSIVTELLWFLRGDTNIKYLVDNNCHIWDGDAYKNYKTYMNNNITETRWSKVEVSEDGRGATGRHYTQEEFINKIKTDDEFAKKWGSLGPVYGKQWRSWAVPRMEPKGFDFDAAWKKHSEIWSANYGEECGPSFGSFCDSILINKNIGIAYGYHTEIDQIANLINDLKTNPDSRRMVVNAWAVHDLPKMVLPPCHYGFQVYTRELSFEERLRLVNYDKEKFASIDEWIKWYENEPNEFYYGGINYTKETALTDLDVPTRAISLMFSMRSIDTFLGLPFNIASYGLLLEIIAKEVNMVPDELIGNLGDTHLYLNHIEQAKEQIGRELTNDERFRIAYKDLELRKKLESESKMLHYPDGHNKVMDDANIPTRTREPYPLPTLNIFEPAIGKKISILDNLHIWSLNCFIIENYQSHPTIKAPLSN